jgi:hypothetical protein
VALPLRLLVLVSALLVAACGSAPTTPVSACCAPSADARVTGVLVGIGGPAGAGSQHWAGTIHVRGRAFTTTRTDRHGHFSLRLPAGRYRFTATSPSYDGGRAVCRAAHPVRLVSHRTTRVRVICQLK